MSENKNIVKVIKSLTIELVHITVNIIGLCGFPGSIGPNPRLSLQVAIATRSGLGDWISTRRKG